MSSFTIFSIVKLYLLLVVLILSYKTYGKEVAASTIKDKPQVGRPSKEEVNRLRDQFMDVLKGIAKVPRTLKPPDEKKLKEIAKDCPEKTFYVSMNPNHREAVSGMEKILRSAKSVQESLAHAANLRNHAEINKKAWYRALVNFAYENPMLESIPKPSPIQVMPDLFIDESIIKKAKTAALGRSKTCVLLDGTSLGKKNGAENKLWYFREDMFLNVHHWFYHIANPYTPPSITNPDRRGELFYYFHHSLLARYNAERLSNGFKLTVPFAPKQGVIIEEGYSSGLVDGISGRSFTDRSPRTPLVDSLHAKDPIAPLTLTMKDMGSAIDRIEAAINAGFLERERGGKSGLSNWKDITLIGDLTQSSNFSVNPKFYGVYRGIGLHNVGHIAISFATDPNYLYKHMPGVMFDEGTAVRDPIFYRFHSYVDTFFDTFQKKLPSYEITGGEFPLLWQGIKVSHLSVHSWGAESSTNELQTYFTFSEIQLSSTLDFRDHVGPEPVASVCSKHLNHEEFDYRITVERDTSVETSKATVRIFMAPKILDGRPASMLTQRDLFFVMDTFTTDLKVGKNQISRKSTESPLTLEAEQSLFDIAHEQSLHDQELGFCGCGWPNHLLLPKGTEAGMKFDIFVMITNGVEDEVKDADGTPPEFCKSSYLHCGSPGRKYPDSKPMGYPFDRMPYKVNGQYVPNIEAYVRGIPNMAVQQVIVKHTGVRENTCCHK